MVSAVHGILQGWILEWVAFPFSRGSSQPRDQTQASHIAGGFFTSWATREALCGHKYSLNWNKCHKCPGMWLLAHKVSINLGVFVFIIVLENCPFLFFFFFYQNRKMCFNHFILVLPKSFRSCPTLCDPMDCSPPGSSVHGIFQARVWSVSIWLQTLVASDGPRVISKKWQGWWHPREVQVPIKCATAVDPGWQLEWSSAGNNAHDQIWRKNTADEEIGAGILSYCLFSFWASTDNVWCLLQPLSHLIPIASL